MEKSTNKFQIIVMIFFGVAVFVAVGLFAGVGPDSKSDQALKGDITIWGTLDWTTFMNAVTPATGNIGDIKITYEDFESNEELKTEFVNALSAGIGPDLIILSGDDIIGERSRLIPWSYDYFPQDMFSDTYVDIGRIFLSYQGVMALPIMVDPLVMYYNKDGLSSNFIIDPPTTWTELVKEIPDFVMTTDAGGVERAGIAMGTFQNIPHAVDILSLIIMQLQNPITITDETSYAVTLADPDINGTVPALDALNFYASFADKNSPYYTWNASLQNAKDMFLAGDLAFYIGYASEFNDIRMKNPNLNFDVAIIPQASDNNGKISNTKLTYGKPYGIAITRVTQNQNAAFVVADAMASHDSAKSFSEMFLMSPIRRSLLNQSVSDTTLRTFYRSAIIARTWWKPDGAVAEQIFEDMITDFNAGNDSASRLVGIAKDRLEDAFRKYAPKVVTEQ